MGGKCAKCADLTPNYHSGVIIIHGSITGDITGDSRSLDYGTSEVELPKGPRVCLQAQNIKP